ncbi:hypothetical protein AWE77_21500 [Escherichia coli]|nr:hypothetical protein AWE77_21500 [Escherichia coli]
MYRVNHIMRTINEMNSYTPHMKVNRISEHSKKLQRFSFYISIASIAALSFIALMCILFNNKNNFIFIIALFFYLINVMGSIIYLLAPILGVVKHLYNLKGELLNDLIYDIDNDEQHIEALMSYSLDELIYIKNCIHVRVINMRAKCFFLGGETAIISILCLSHYAFIFIKSINTGLFLSMSLFDEIIILFLIIICYASLMSMIFKRKFTYLQSLDRIIDMAIKIKNSFYTEINYSRSH